MEFPIYFQDLNPVDAAILAGLDGGRCFPTGGSRIGKGIDY